MATTNPRRRRRGKQRKIVGFYRQDGKTKPITKRSDFSPKMIHGSRRFKNVSPNKSGIIKRLKSLDPTNVKLVPLSKPRTEYMFGIKVLRYGKISFDFDGRHVEDDVVIVPHEFWVASWSRTKPEVYVDDNARKNLWETLSFHEAQEKNVAENYGLEPDIEAHEVAQFQEKRRFLKTHTKKELEKAVEHIENVQRDEWIYLQQFGTPMLTPIIRPHHGGGKRKD